MKVKTFVILLLICIKSLFAQNHRLVQLDTANMNKVKGVIQKKTASPDTKKAYKGLLKNANKFLKKENPTVINKTIKPPSKNKNDYLSISRYWWPDETAKNGLPWIKRDGETNPDTQSDAVDRKRLSRMTNAVKALGLAYFFTEKESYAKKGVSVIRTWFLDKKTKMNPHLTYAQSVPGKDKPRRSGILDGREIPSDVLDAITLFSKSKHWTDKDNEEMDNWLNDYLNWLITSKVGMSGFKQENNHGSWYNFQVAALASYLNNEELLEKILIKSLQNLDIQLDENGGQTHELKRTRSYFYSCFNLDALTRIAIIAEKNNFEFWNATTPNGNNLQKAIEFLIPYTKGEAEWEYKSKGIDASYFAPILLRSSKKIDSTDYKPLVRDIMDKLKTENQKGRVKRTIQEYYLSNKGVI